MDGAPTGQRAGTLAIDLGSSTTVVAWQGSQGPERLLPLPPYSLDDPCVVPSLLWLSSPGQERPLIGRQVLEAGLAERPGPGLLRDFKRRIGAPRCEPLAVGLEPDPASGSHADGQSQAPSPWRSPEQAGALLLQHLWRALPADINPERLILTAPIDTYRAYRDWLLEASRELPVPEVALVDEPTAAAIGAGLPAGSRVLVVDLGGGTLDLSLVALEGGEGRAAPIAQLLRFAGRDLGRSGQALRCARVIGKAGLPLGGRDIDRWILADLLPELPASGEPLRLAEQLKCCLSSAEEAVRVWLPPEGPAQELRLSRPRLEQLLQERGLLRALEELLERVLAAARREGLGLGDIAALLPVGGGSRMPLVRRWLESRCPGVPIRDRRPVEAVALGALALTPNVRLRDVLDRGVALRCWDRRSGRHHWHPLFVAGQCWPTEHPLELLLACSRDGQHQLELVLGEPQAEGRAEVVFEAGLPRLRPRAAGPASISPWGGEPVRLPLGSPGVAGHDRLRLRFAIDGEGLLTVSGDDLQDGTALGPIPLGRVH